MVLYAGDTVNNLEANGRYEDFYVGGSKSDFVFESNGPDIDMYLNTAKFKSGQVVDATPVFIANLYDENGINVVGAGIGHDLQITLNDNSNLSYVLNDYYQSSVDNYKSGTVTYEIPELDNGYYTLTFRAWDLLDNSSEKSLNFWVKNGVSPRLYDFYAAPNPAENYVNFIIKHDQPQSTLSIKIEVYTLTGDLLWSKKESVYAEESETTIYWNLTTDAGHKLDRGLYIYKIAVVSEEDSNESIKSNKLIVK
jgi:hypothetical protein